MALFADDIELTLEKEVFIYLYFYTIIFLIYAYFYGTMQYKLELVYAYQRYSSECREHAFYKWYRAEPQEEVFIYPRLYISLLSLIYFWYTYFYDTA